jgi:hypothetical protein
VFANAGHPLEEPEENKPKETALKNRRAPSWNATKPGFYVRPGPGRQPYWFKVPAGLASGRKTVIKTYTDAGRNIPKAVRTIFKIGENVQTAGAVQQHVVKMGLDSVLRINDRQATRLTKKELLAVARNMNIAQVNEKSTPAALIGWIQWKAGVGNKPNRSYDVYVNGMYYTIGNNGRVTRTTSEGVQTPGLGDPPCRGTKLVKKLLSVNVHSEYNALPKANKFNALRAMANLNRKKKEAAANLAKQQAAKAKANAEARAKAAAEKAKKNAEEAAKENAEAEAFAVELEFAIRLAQNLGNMYTSGNEQGFLAEYKKLPSGSRGKPLKVNVEKAYKLFTRNLKRSDRTSHSRTPSRLQFQFRIGCPPTKSMRTRHW